MEINTRYGMPSAECKSIKENNFCEWKYYKNKSYHNYITKCNYIYKDIIEHDFKYCPYCGKKIKEVK